MIFRVFGCVLRALDWGWVELRFLVCMLFANLNPTARLQLFGHVPRSLDECTRHCFELRDPLLDKLTAFIKPVGLRHHIERVEPILNTCREGPSAKV